MTLSHTKEHIKGKTCFLACAVEVVEDAELFRGVKLHALRPQTVEIPDEVSTDTGKIVSGFFNILLADRYGHILILHNGVCSRGFIKQHPVILFAVLIKTVLRHRD